MNFLQEAREKFIKTAGKKGLLDGEVRIVGARPLTPAEAIGRPGRDDFPLLKGKEVLLQAEFAGAKGQAYTSSPGSYTGRLKDVLELPLDTDFHRAVFTASLNAVLRHLGLVEKTVHCQNQEPALCAAQLVHYVSEQFGRPKIAFIGLQPAMVEALAVCFPIRVTDLDPDNVGKTKCGVLIEDVSRTQEIIDWADVVLATGTTAVNGTLPGILESAGTKPLFFYGTTIAGIAHLMGYRQVCFRGH